MKVYAIGNDLFVMGMRFAGIPGMAIDSGAAMQQALTQKIAENDCGIIFLGATEAAQIRTFIDELKIHRSLPIILEVSDGKTILPPNKLAKFLKNSLGISIE